MCCFPTSPFRYVIPFSSFRQLCSWPKFGMFVTNVGQRLNKKCPLNVATFFLKLLAYISCFLTSNDLNQYSAPITCGLFCSWSKWIFSVPVPSHVQQVFNVSAVFFPASSKSNPQIVKFLRGACHLGEVVPWNDYNQKQIFVSLPLCQGHKKTRVL